MNIPEIVIIKNPSLTSIVGEESDKVLKKEVYLPDRPGYSFP